MNINYFVKEVIVDEIWSLIEVKNYLRISHVYDDLLIISLIDAAKETAEKFTGLCLNKKIIECKVQNTQASLTLKYVPILEILEISKKNNNVREIITNKFDLTNIASNQINITSEYIGQDLEIKFVAGYRVLPKMLRHAILLHVSLMYDCPQEGIKLTNSIRDLYQPFRIIKI